MGTPVIGGDTTGAVLEDSGALVSGDLNDVGIGTGNTDDVWSIAAAATYGAATINPSTGEWTYDLDDSNPFVDALDPGETLIDTFTVLMTDTSGAGNGQTDTQVVTITITGVVCLTSGALIETGDGERPIESLEAGDLIVTQSGPKEIAWIGRRVIELDELAQNPKLLPIRIKAGALGNGLPRRDLLVSRQHRMLVKSAIAKRMFGVDEVLVPAIKLTGLPGIYIDASVERVEYFHLLFDRHEIIYAEGAPTESLLTGPEALKTRTPQMREEIIAIFPEVADLDHEPEPARVIPPGYLQAQLVARHRKNGKPILEAASARP